METVHVSRVAALVVLGLAARPAGATEETNKFKQPHAVEIHDDAVLRMDRQGTAVLVDVWPGGKILQRTVARGRPEAVPRLLVSGRNVHLWGARLDGEDRLHLLWSATDDPASPLSNQLRYARTNAAGELSAPVDVGLAAAADVQGRLSVEPSGRAHVLRLDTGNGVLKKGLLTEGALDSLHTITGAVTAEMEVGPGGEAFLIYVVGNECTYTYQTVDLDGTLGKPIPDVATYGCRGTGVRSYVQLLVDSQGNTHILSELVPGATATAPTANSYTRVTLAGEVSIQALPGGGVHVRSFQAGALDAQRGLHVAAAAHGPQGTLQLVTTRLLDGVVTGGRQISLPPGVINGIAISPGPSGRDTVVWGLDKRSTVFGADIYAARPATSRVRNVSRQSRTHDVLQGLATAPDGGAVVLWRADGRGMFSTTYR